MRRLRGPLLVALLLLLAGLGLYRALNSDDAASPPSTASVTTAAIPPPPTATAPELAPPAAPPTVATASGVPIHLVRRPRLGLPAGTPGAAYARLKALAESGDVPAQYQLGLVLYECRDVPADEKTLGREIETTYQTHRRGGWDVDSPKDEEASLRRRYAECAGIPAEARGGYRDWLRKAADAGLLEAQLDLPLKLPQAEYCQFISECSPKQRAQQEALSHEAVDYLSRAREAGSANALWTFGAWYAEGDVLPRNDIEAYAAFSALDQIEAAAGQPRRFGGMLKDLRSRLRPIDHEQAEERAKAILGNPNCCVVMP